MLLLLLQVPISLNEAFCDRYERVCPPSDELTRECGKVGGRPSSESAAAFLWQRWALGCSHSTHACIHMRHLGNCRRTRWPRHCRRHTTRWTCQTHAVTLVSGAAGQPQEPGCVPTMCHSQPDMLAST